MPLGYLWKIQKRDFFRKHTVFLEYTIYLIFKSVQVCNFFHITHLSMYKWDHFQIKWLTTNIFPKLCWLLKFLDVELECEKKHLGLLLSLWRARILTLNTKVGLLFHFLIYLFIQHLSNERPVPEFGSTMVNHQELVSYILR